MSSDYNAAPHERAILGNPTHNFWLYDSNTGYDLTHPSTPTSPTISSAYTIQTTTEPITISPSKSALVIIDMQNFFLSPLLGKPTESNGIKAQDQLLKYAIPAARKAGIQIIWVNWGLTDSDLATMPPATWKAFGFEKAAASELPFYSEGERSNDLEDPDANLKQPSTYRSHGPSPTTRGLGSDMGTLTSPNSSSTNNSSSTTSIHAGTFLMRDQWNTSLHAPLEASYESSLNTTLPDVWIHKTCFSGLHLPSTPLNQYLSSHGLMTLFFAGVNTDSCVLGTVQDAYTLGYDCVLLRDGCGTSAPAYAQEMVERNCERAFGFVVGCEEFAEMRLK